jgi:two-component system, OmpR family, sensor kinase
MSIRVRIVLLSTLLMAVVLVSVSLGVYQMLTRSMESDIDRRLLDVVEDYRQQSHIVPAVGGPGILSVPEDLDPFTYPGLYLQIVDSSGSAREQSSDYPIMLDVPESVMESNLDGDAVYFTSGVNSEQDGDTIYFTGGVSGENDVRVISAPLKSQDGTVFATIQAFEWLGPMEQALDQLKLFLFSGSLIGLTMTAIGSYMLAGQSLRPLTHITEAVRSVGQSRDLKHQVRTPATNDEIQQLAETFNHMLARLDAAFHAERRFVGDASHELRTPLTALRGNAEILLRQLDSSRMNPDDMREGLGDIRDEAERMGRLVEHLLTLARADVGWRPDMQPVSLEKVVRDAARVANPLATDHVFRTEIDEELEIEGDPDQLRQLLLILLDNAFAYTPLGKTVTLRTSSEGGFARIDVIDEGPGMTEEQVNRIFDRFYRGSEARNGGATGAGLGLAIARWIADCHAGHISAYSAPDAGTRMTIRIPLSLPQEAPLTEEDEGSSPMLTKRRYPLGD